MKLDYLNTHFINSTYRQVVAAASTISYRLDFSCENCLPFFGIFGCTWWKYMILAKSVLRRISAPDRALNGRWNVEKRGPKYVLLSTNFSDDFWHQNGPVRAPSDTRNAPPGSPGRPQDRATAWEPFGGMLTNAWKHHVCEEFAKVSKKVFWKHFMS